MKPNTTRTEEIEVCGECQEDVQEREKRWHYFVCPRCLETSCANVSPAFSVIVQENTPRNYPRKRTNSFGVDLNTAPAHSLKHHDEYKWRARYCSECADHIKSVLTAAGLIRTPKTEEVGAVMDADF